MSRCHACFQRAPREKVRVNGQMLRLCCDCRKKVRRHDARPLLPVVRVGEIIERRTPVFVDDVTPLDVLSYVNQRGVK